MLKRASQATPWFETERTVVREPAEHELAELHSVYASNPEYLALTEGSGGEPGRYDVDALARDLAVAKLVGREVLAVSAKDDGRLVGVIDLLDSHPDDGCPWIGLLMIHREHQRRGLGSEVLTGLLEHGRLRGWRVARAGVVERNAGALLFAERHGFVPVRAATEQLASGPQRVVVLERRLD